MEGIARWQVVAQLCQNLRSRVGAARTQRCRGGDGRFPMPHLALHPQRGVREALYVLARGGLRAQGATSGSCDIGRAVQSLCRALCREYTAWLAIWQAACRNSVSAPLRRVPKGGLLRRGQC